MYAPDTTHLLSSPVIAEEAPVDSGMVQPRAVSGAATAGLPKSATVLKVSTRSRPSAVAGAIAGVMRQHASVEVQSIGAGATNQAIKAIAIAHNYLRDDHIQVGCVPFFIDVAIDGEERTALRLVIERYPV
jgi:stage V sporulation protein S